MPPILGYALLSRAANFMIQDEELGEVRAEHRLDQVSLGNYLAKHIEGVRAIERVRQFVGGQSNPTYLVSTSDQDFVLRKKPPGHLLPSAHAVEREYRIYSALADSEVPVPNVLLLCEDESVVGTPFFVMEYVQGAVFKDPNLPDLSPGARKSIYYEMIRVLAALHSVNIEHAGLTDFGKAGNYFERQSGRWTQQYLASQTEKIDSMDRLIDWLPTHLPTDEETTIVHGDFQLYNMLYTADGSHCLALLDWELSTLGNPLADLAYNCMKYYTHDRYAVNSELPGIPSESDLITEYCRLTNRKTIPNWTFCLAFSFFRMASIVQGVYKRGLQGNASSDAALSYKDMVREYADIGWQIATSN